MLEDRKSIQRREAKAFSEQASRDLETLATDPEWSGKLPGWVTTSADAKSTVLGYHFGVIGDERHFEGGVSTFRGCVQAAIGFLGRLAANEGDLSGVNESDSRVPVVAAIFYCAWNRRREVRSEQIAPHGGETS